MSEYLEENKLDLTTERPDLTTERLEAVKQFRRAHSFLLHDAPTEPVDAIFMHPLSHGDDDEMFPLAAELLAQKKANYIVLNGSNGEKLGETEPGKAWAGKDDYIRRLKQHGVAEQQIIVAGPAYHTRQNNDVFLEAAKKHGFKTAVTLNQPQQLLRATLGQIKVMNNREFPYPMQVYATYPEPWDANKKVYGSQGAEQKRRYKLLLDDELDRIISYQAKGDIASFDEFFEYMNKRADIH